MKQVVKKRNISLHMADIRPVVRGAALPKDSRGAGGGGFSVAMSGQKKEIFIFSEQYKTAHGIIGELESFFEHEKKLEKKVGIFSGQAADNEHETGERLFHPFSLGEESTKKVALTAVIAEEQKAEEKKGDIAIAPSPMELAPFSFGRLTEYGLLMGSAFAITLFLVVGGYSYVPRLLSYAREGVVSPANEKQQTQEQATPKLSENHVVVSEHSDDIFKDDVLMRALGYEGPQKYLVAFQNTLVPRPTGGVLSAYASFTLEKGELKDFTAGSMYDLDAGLKAKENPPRPLLLHGNIWGMNNANWFYQFPVSGEKLAYFFEDATGTRPDMVVVADIRSLFKEFFGYGDSELIAMPPAQAQEIAVGLFEGITNVEHSITDKKNYFTKALAQKEIMLYSTDKDMQALFDQNDVAGRALLAQRRDGFVPVATSLDANPSHYLLGQAVSDSVAFLGTGGVRHAVTVDMSFALNPQYRRAGKDVYYMKFYLPKGHSVELEGAKGFFEPKIKAANSAFRTDAMLEAGERTKITDSANRVEVYEEGESLVIGGFFEVKGAKASVTVSYVVPRMYKDSRGYYVLHIAKQPGIDASLSVHASAEGSLAVEPISHKEKNVVIPEMGPDESIVLNVERAYD